MDKDKLANPATRWDVLSRDKGPMAFLYDIFHREPLKKSAGRRWGSSSSQTIGPVIARRPSSGCSQIGGSSRSSSGGRTT